MPRISVLMPVYNCRKYIEESVNSILKQTFSDFEFLIIDGCSTDGTYEYLQSLSDSRIKLIREAQKSGIVNALNMGIVMAKGEYIARMDADDISLPQRLDIQFQILENNPQISVCGTSYFTKDENKVNLENITRTDRTENSFEVYMHLFFSCAVCHPSVMIRNKILIDNKLFYDTDFKDAEDFEFWVRISKISQIINISDPLLIYRLHGNNLSGKQFVNMINATGVVINKSFRREGIELNEELSLLLAQSIEAPQPGLLSLADFKAIAEVFITLKNKFSNSSKKRMIAEIMLNERWYNICSWNSSNFFNFIKAYRYYNKTLYNRYIHKTLITILKSKLGSISRKLKQHLPNKKNSKS